MADSVEDLLRSLIREESQRGFREERERLASLIRALREEILELTGRAPGQAHFLTVEEAAQRARHSPDSIRQWIKEGRLSRCGTARKLLVREDELQSLLTEGDQTDGRAVDIEARLRSLLGEA